MRYKPNWRQLFGQLLLAPLKIPKMILSPLLIEWRTYNQSRVTRRRFSHRLLRELVKAGWYEGRKISGDVIAKMYDVPIDFFTVQAMQILEEFGGLRIGDRGALLYCRQDSDSVRIVSNLVGSQLCPFGVTAYYCDTGGLWVDEQGRIFVTNVYEGTNESFDAMLEYVAGSFVEALEFLVAGAKASVWPASAANEGIWYFKCE